MDFWFLYAFFASGFEYSVTNMAVFSMALLGDHPDSVSLFGMFYNLFFVTLGNIVSGCVFMVIGYWAASPKVMDKSSKPAQKIQLILNGSFELLLVIYELIKRYALIAFEMANKKLEENKQQNNKG